jgi:hypothetical protein
MQHSRCLSAAVGKPARAAEWIARKQSTHVSGNGPKWEWAQVGTNARTRRRVDRPSVAAPPAHAHTRTHGPTRCGSRSLTSGRFAVGNNTTLVAVVAAGFGSVALLLVVLILRNRRATRAVEAAPGLRAPFLGE